MHGSGMREKYLNYLIFIEIPSLLHIPERRLSVLTFFGCPRGAKKFFVVRKINTPARRATLRSAADNLSTLHDDVDVLDCYLNFGVPQRALPRLLLDSSFFFSFLMGRMAMR
jgi:hypothetical protein